MAGELSRIVLAETERTGKEKVGPSPRGSIDDVRDGNGMPPFASLTCNLKCSAGTFVDRPRPGDGDRHAAEDFACFQSFGAQAARKSPRPRRDRTSIPMRRR